MPHFNVMPLEVVRRDESIIMWCTAGQDEVTRETCLWHWRLYEGMTMANGRAIDAAIEHVKRRHTLG